MCKNTTSSTINHVSTLLPQWTALPWMGQLRQNRSWTRQYLWGLHKGFSEGNALRGTVQTLPEVVDWKKSSWHAIKNCVYNPSINGLVTRCSSLTTHLQTHWWAGFVKAKGFRLERAFMRQPSLKLVHQWVFCFFAPTRQGASANGLNGLNPRNTAPISPVGKRRTALVERLLKHLVHGGTRPNV